MRISYVPGKFTKGHADQWSDELLTIVGIRYTAPVTYVLEDVYGERVTGTFYEQEMQKTALPDFFLVEKIRLARLELVQEHGLGVAADPHAHLGAAHQQGSTRHRGAPRP